MTSRLTLATALLSTSLLAPFGTRNGHDLDHAILTLQVSSAPLVLEGIVGCSTVSISSRGYYLGAAHCADHDLDGTLDHTEFQIRNTPATVVWFDSKLDLAIFAAPLAPSKAIEPSRESLHVGDLVALYGYPGGRDIPIFLSARVSNLHVTMDRMDGPEDTIERDFILLDRDAFRGMSGGPVVDVHGRLIGIIQRTNGVAFSARLDVILAATERYWEAR